jgi:hypothetical protein
MPRIEVSSSAWLEAGSRREVVTVHNLSDGGAMIETRVPLVAHEQVVLTLDGFRPAPANVRWVQDVTAGLAFAPELPWQEVMPWLRRRTRTGTDPRPAGGKALPAHPPREPRRVGKEGIALNLPARLREGSFRWLIEVKSIDTRQVRFVSHGAIDPGKLFWLCLPGLEGWPARVTDVDGDRITCAFTQPLHPAVLERIIAAAGTD